MAQVFRAFASAEFSASHLIEGHSTCGRRHGHRWRVDVVIRAAQDPATGVVVGSERLVVEVREFAAELHRDDIGAMLPGTPPTAEGVALILRERLTMNFAVDEVRVTMDGEQGISVQ